MKEEIKNLENTVEFTIEKRWKRLVSAVKKILLMKILVLEKLNKIN